MQSFTLRNCYQFK